MPFNRIYQFLFKRAAPLGRAKGAIGGMPPCPPRNLRNFSGVEMAHRPPVKFDIICQRHMADIHIQPHPDSVGGDHKIHIPVLEQLHLGIAGARG